MMGVLWTMLTYQQITQIPSFQERFQLLYKAAHYDGREWGTQRFYNQAFYHSKEWKDVRDMVIVRDKSLNLAHPDYLVGAVPNIHHIMPIDLRDIRNGNYDKLLNPDNLITTNDLIHKAIHYGDGRCPYQQLVVRTPYDTCPWRL